MRRLSTTLCALAFLWACGATVYLLWASTPTGVAASAMLAAAEAGTARMPPLATAPGVWMAGLLATMTLLAGIPLGVALGSPGGLRPTAWTVAGVLAGICLLAGTSVGALYLPSALLLAAAGRMAQAWGTVPAGEDP